MALSTTYDGDFTKPVQHGPAMPYYDNDSRSVLIEVTMRQLVQSWTPLKLSTPWNGSISTGGAVEAGYTAAQLAELLAQGYTLHEINAGLNRLSSGSSRPILVEEGAPRLMGGSICEWTRTYAYIPPARTVAEEYAMQYQFILGSSGTYSLFEFTKTTSSRVDIDWWHTTDGSTIPIIAAFRAVQIGSSLIKYTGTVPAGQWQVAQDSAIEIWKGNIWRRRTRYVPVITPATLS